jgi:general stress protein 26
MTSINQQQPEQNRQNRQDLAGTEAVRKIQELVDRAKTCFFCTAVATGQSSAARPMNVRKVDDSGRLWFLSARDSHLVQELGIDPHVRLYFQGSPHSDFLCLSGQARLSTSRPVIEELWEPVLKTWFTEGIHDPRITVIEMTPSEGYYWDNKHGDLVAGIKMLVGAALGKTLDDSIEGRLQV